MERQAALSGTEHRFVLCFERGLDVVVDGNNKGCVACCRRGSEERMQHCSTTREQMVCAGLRVCGSFVTTRAGLRVFCDRWCGFAGRL